ncbi:unnamed protein product [Calicophoron daubneyi]|uniref:EF-hand domain-containing protein n=1 Tax=Calicophoron daubneyi TaxID=300641 RepID=A0AAV2TNE7_CALDB
MAWFSYRQMFSLALLARRRIRTFSPAFCGCLATGAGFAAYIYFKKPVNSNGPSQKKTVSQLHERRFRKFASVEHNGILFMTPADFLVSLIKDSAPEHKITALNERQVEAILYRTPPKHKGSANFFRELRSNGLLTYSEYLFLLHILTKPRSGFEIAFKMLDTDRSGCVDAEEFATLNHVTTKLNEEILPEGESLSLVPADENAFDTTLMVHLFGTRRRDPLSFDDFMRFMQNFQTESLEFEFGSYSVDGSTISPVDFARILLRHTTVSKSDYKAFIQRLNGRLDASTRISFAEFKKFFDFLNCLDDFALAMKLYTVAERPISFNEFRRAVKAVTGYELGTDILKTVFALFDVDDDGHLSYQEFVQIMRERRSRGLQLSSSHGSRRKMYRNCVVAKLQESAS